LNPFNYGLNLFPYLCDLLDQKGPTNENTKMTGAKKLHLDCKTTCSFTATKTTTTTRFYDIFKFFRKKQKILFQCVSELTAAIL